MSWTEPFYRICTDSNRTVCWIKFYLFSCTPRSANYSSNLCFASRVPILLTCPHFLLIFNVKSWYFTIFSKSSSFILKSARTAMWQHHRSVYQQLLLLSLLLLLLFISNALITMMIRCTYFLHTMGYLHLCISTLPVWCSLQVLQIGVICSTCITVCHECCCFLISHDHIKKN